MKKNTWIASTRAACPVLNANTTARAEALASRLEDGAKALAEFAAGLSQSDWETRVVKDGRKIGVVVHHVATLYPIEIQLAKAVAAGHAITNVSWDDIATMNREHSRENDGVTKEATLTLLATNSAAAALAIRSFSDEQLDRATPVSLNSGAPLTCQFVLEDHAVRHSFHHLARMKATLAGVTERGAK